MERTLMLIKPDAVRAHAVGRIIARVEEAGFRVRGMRMLRLAPEEAAEFYREHRERPFFRDLVELMTSGPIVALSLEREDAVAALRAVIGATDSRKADKGTLRAEFGTDNQRNAVHGSDSAASAARETAFFFREIETIRTAAD